MYTLKIVYKKLTPSLEQKIISMWTNDGDVSLQEAIQRVHSVVVIILDQTENVVGVSTVNPDNFRNNNDPYYLYGMYVEKNIRGNKALKSSLNLFDVTYDYLKSYESEKKMNGIVTVTENPRISERIMIRQGWTYYGKGPKSKNIWYKNF